MILTGGRGASEEGFFAMKRQRLTGNHVLRFLCVLL
jgi:hypothetical protein